MGSGIFLYMKLAIFLIFFAASSLFSCAVQKAEDRAGEDPGAMAEPTAVREPVLVELFTSEGCSSCPPGDRQLAFLEKQQPVGGAEVITLAFHVDYWNRMGWADKYSSAEFSERQNSYVERLRLTSSYTPQMVVDGQAEFVGSDAGRASDAIAKAAANPKPRVDFKLTRSGADVEIGNIPKHESATVYLAVAEDNIVTDVKSGENGGLKLPHISVVRKLNTIGQLSNTATSFKNSFELPSDPAWKKDQLKYIVFIQENGSGRVMAVGKINAVRG